MTGFGEHLHEDIGGGAAFRIVITAETRLQRYTKLAHRAARQRFGIVAASSSASDQCCGSGANGVGCA
jgi:hypothetical protein